MLAVTLAVGCGAAPAPPVFDGERAFALLERQVAFGPRIPGTESHDAARDWLADRLREHTPRVSEQHFSAEIDGTGRDCANIIASLHPDKTDRILLCAHWDTRPWADRDPDPARRDNPVPGANDGASGVAVLLELAAVLAEADPPVGIDIALFDAEDAGSYSQPETWCLGSRHFAGVMPVSFRPRYAVLLDMIGDKNLSLTPERQAMAAAPAVWERVRSAAARAGVAIESEPLAILDDHVPLLNRGIPAVDLIDFDYPAWHTTADIPAQCSPESLARIGTLVLDLIYGE